MTTVPSSGPISLRDIKAVMNPSELIKARYLRFQYGNAYGSVRAMNLAGVRVYTSAGGSNIVSPSMATSYLDLHSPGFTSANMVDNDDSTIYHSSGSSEYPWVKIDLGSE